MRHRPAVLVLALTGLLCTSVAAGAEEVFPDDAHVLARFEFDGDARDASGHGRHAKLLGGDFVDAPQGEALRLAGTDAVGLDWSAFAPLLTHPYTIEMVLTPAATSPWGKIFGFDDSDDTGWYYKENGFQAYPNEVVGVGKVHPGVRHYLAFVSTAADRVQVYFQGELLGETHASFTAPPRQAFFFRDDGHTGRSEQIAGIVEALRLSRGSRSPEEIGRMQERVAKGGASNIVAVRFLDDRHQPVDSRMLGEPFFVEVEYARKPERLRPVALAWGEGRETSSPLSANPDRSDPERVFFLSDRLLLAPSGTGGPLTAAGGDVVEARVGGRTASLQMEAPAVRIRVVTLGAADVGAQAASMTSYEPFRIEVTVPHEQAQQIGDELTVNLQSLGADDNEDLALQRQGNVSGPVRYTNVDPVTLAKGTAWAHIMIFPLWTMKPVDTQNGDTLVVTYSDAETRITVYDKEVQQAIAMYRKGFESLRDFLAAALVKPGLSQVAREVLLAKLELMKNALTVAAQTRENDDLWSDYKALRILQEYADLVEADATGWTKAPEDKRRYARFGIIVRTVEDLDAIQRGFDRAKRDHEQAYYQGLWAVAEGTYQVVTNLTLANQLHTAIFGIDNTGRRVDVTHRILAGVEAGSIIILVGASLGHTPGELAPSGRGFNAFEMRARPTRVRRAGIGGEEFLLEVYGGRSEVDFITSVGGRRYDSFSRSGMVGRESKVGPTSLNERVRRELACDAELLASGQVKRVEWHFFANEAGQFGPTGPLLAELQRLGIKIIERPDLRLR